MVIRQEAIIHRGWWRRGGYMKGSETPTVQVYCAPICGLPESKIQEKKKWMNRKIQQKQPHFPKLHPKCRKVKAATCWTQGQKMCSVISRRDRRVSKQVSLIIMNQINLNICFFFLINVHKRPFLSMREGGQTKRNEMGSGTGTTDWLGDGMTRHDTDMRATPKMLRQHLIVEKPAIWVCPHCLRSPGSANTLFQSSSLAWSGRDAVRNVLNGRSMRRLVGND